MTKEIFVEKWTPAGADYDKRYARMEADLDALLAAEREACEALATKYARDAERVVVSGGREGGPAVTFSRGMAAQAHEIAAAIRGRKP